MHGCRFEVPSQYRHMHVLYVRYVRWDLSHAILIDPHSNTCLGTLYPQDKSDNASGLRRTLNQSQDQPPQEKSQPDGIAPLLKKLMAEYAATGLPPAYLTKNEEKKP